MDSCLNDLKEYECEIRINELSVKCLLYTDDQVILAPSVCGLQEMVNKIDDYIKKKGMKHAPSRGIGQGKKKKEIHPKLFIKMLTSPALSDAASRIYRRFLFMARWASSAKPFFGP
ncbi:hypothetical protein EVAR_39433_1 [Eumeta japonica]|uniref:Reverse transcriptase domain-containing protein n=1 Tax=Eumeta variegata TaxID=151549 RepID=A0A4C1W2X6_EUMVA|nr:hypothetical protein EVAR_39433_1 [Eumeta japonica]